MIKVVPHLSIELSENNKNRLYELMKRAYAITEEDIWGKDYNRLESEEFFQLLDTSIFFVALEGDQILGSVQVYQKDGTTFGFGLLNIDLEHTGKNIGAQLVQSAEQYAKEKGGTTMQLEVLRIEEPISEFKKWLHQWYQQLGYTYIDTVQFESIEPNRPEKRKIMKANAVFDIFRKTLN